MSEFMVVLRGNDPEMKSYSPDQVQTAMERYVHWVDLLKKENRYRGGSPFKEGTKLLSRRQNFVIIMDAPYRQNNEALTGYFVIAAKDFPEAVEIAKGCPALVNGETVEVIELDNH